MSNCSFNIHFHAVILLSKSGLNEPTVRWCNCCWYPFALQREVLLFPLTTHWILVTVLYLLHVLGRWSILLSRRRYGGRSNACRTSGTFWDWHFVDEENRENDGGTWGLRERTFGRVVPFTRIQSWVGSTLRSWFDRSKKFGQYLLHELRGPGNYHSSSPSPPYKLHSIMALSMQFLKFQLQCLHSLTQHQYAPALIAIS